MTLENPLTLPLVPLAIVAPLVTAANYAYETTFAARWTKRVAHSYRIAWSGSDLEARIAGAAHATRAAHTSTPPATTMVTGS